MRIAYVCMDPGVPVFGRKGCSIHVQQVARTLIRQGRQVELFAQKKGGQAPQGLEKAPITELPKLPKGNSIEREKACLGANQQLGSALQLKGPFDLVYERYSLWSFAGMEYARDHDIPGVLEINAPLIQEQAEHRQLNHRAIAQQVADRVFDSASALIAVSKEVAGYLESYPGASRKIHIVPNGIDAELFSADKAGAAKSTNEFTVGFVGSLKPWHGLFQLLESFHILSRKHPDARLRIVGDGPERERIEEEIARRNLGDAVDLTGSVPHEDIPKELARMDVAVAPYPDLPYFYFSPLKIFEYMAAGLPVAASGIGQIKQIIQPGENGLLCPPGDPEALAYTLIRLKQNPKMRKELGQNARAAVLENHTWDKAVRRILKIAENRGNIHKRKLEAAF